MTRLPLLPGLPIARVRDRLGLAGLGLPAVTAAGVDPATSARPQVTCTSGGAHVKGAWVEVVAATDRETNGIYLTLSQSTSASATNTSTLLDIGVGEAGAEVVVVPDLAVGYSPLFTTLFLPVRIPAGSRVAVRCQGAVAAQAVPAVYTFVALPELKRAPSTLVNLGADPATSRGVSIANPAVANVKTAYTTLVAATPQPFAGLIVCPQSQGVTTIVSSTALVDIALGAAGAEVVIPGAADLFMVGNTSEYWGRHLPFTIPCAIPAGSRVAARWSSSSTANRLDLTVLGIPA